MMLYNFLSPNGVRVDIFMAEKKIEIPTRKIDLLAHANRDPAFTGINSLQQVPVLQLDDGRHLCESIAICRYLETLHPEPPLFDKDALDSAFVEMWMRLMEFTTFAAVSDIALHGLPIFSDRIEQNAESAQSCRRKLERQFEWFDREISDGRPFVAGDRFTMADIVGMSTLLAMAFLKIEIAADLAHAGRWAERVRSRPSFPSLKW
ncbi:MAG: glutathione S-transferase family protein [Geminicoccaceae bacterium]